MEPRHGIAVAVGKRPAPLGPADDGKPAHAHGMQPGALLACGKIQIGLCPQPRPVIFRPIEARRSHPVLKGQIMTVADAHQALFGTVDEEQATQRPEGLPTEVLFPLLVKHDHLAAAICGLRRCDQPGKPCPNDKHIAIHPPLLQVRIEHQLTCA